MDQRPRKYLLCGGVFLVAATFVVETLSSTEEEEGSNELRGVSDVLSSLQNLAVDAWLVVGMGLAGLRAAGRLLRAPLDPDLSVGPLVRSMLLGWGFSEAFFAATFLVFDASESSDLAKASHDLVELA